MTAPEVNMWLPAVAALAGALIGSISPVVVGLLNARAETRGERLRLAVQVAIEDHHHMLTHAVAKAKSTGMTVGVPPMSALVAYHAEVLELLQKAERLEPDDFVSLKARAKAVFEAPAQEVSGDS